MTIAMQLIALAIQLEPSIAAAINAATLANDISDADLLNLRNHAHADVQALGERIAAAKASAPQ